MNSGFQMPGMVQPQLGNFGYGSGMGTNNNFGLGSMPGSSGAAVAQPGMWQGMQQWGKQAGSKIGGVLGSTGFQQGMGAFSTLANMYTGFKSLGLAKDQLNFQKKAWNKNYQAQVKDYENTLKDRWTARNASARTRGGSQMQGMNEWVGDRAIGG